MNKTCRQLLHSASLDPDPSSKPQPSNFFYLSYLFLKLNPPRQTKSPDNSNMLHMFNNNT